MGLGLCTVLVFILNHLVQDDTNTDMSPTQFQYRTVQYNYHFTPNIRCLKAIFKLRMLLQVVLYKLFALIFFKGICVMSLY